MHPALKNATPEVLQGFKQIVIDIAEEVQDTITPECFYSCIRRAVHGYVQEDRPNWIVAWTPSMEHTLYEITRDALLAAYQFTPSEDEAEALQCLNAH